VRKHNILFLCTGNSARSIIAECLLNSLGRTWFNAYSAGASPAGEVNPFALRLLEQKGHDISSLRSKSWDEFTRPDAPAMDFVITVCDNAAAQPCPVWPQRPASAHWSLPDPAATQGQPDEIMAAFEKTYASLHSRLTRLTAAASQAASRENLLRTLKAMEDL